MAPTDEFPAGVWINPTLTAAITKAPWARENPGGDQERNNDHRRRDARLVLTAYRKMTMTDPAADPESESVPDLLCDLFHLCDELGIDIEAAIVKAEMNHIEEQPDIE